MPGIIGLLLSNKNINKSKLLERMLFSIHHRPDYKLFKFNHKDSPFSGALATLKELAPKAQPVINNFNHILFFDGELYNNYTKFNDAEYILELYKHNKDFNFLADLEGIFSLAFYDGQNQKLYLASDKFGLKPLYYIKTENDFLFSSEVKSLLCYPSISKRLDIDALSFLFHFSFILGNNTLFDDIKLLPHASILIYDFKNKDISIKPYWDPRSLFTPQGEHKYIKDTDIVDIFVDAVKKRLKNKEFLGISLSGGLDSRTILAALGKEAQGMPSYTLGLKGCQDERFSAQMAQMAGTNHVFLPITENDLRDFISLVRTLIFYSDGFYHSCESTEKVALDYFKKAPFKILFRGHGGEIAKASLTYPVPADRRTFSLKTCSDLVKFVVSFSNLSFKEDLNNLFTPDFSYNIRDRARSYLEEKFSTLINILHPTDIIIYFFIYEYIRRQAVASLNIFRTQVEIRLPFMDERFLAKVLELPIEKRYAGEIHYKIIKHTMPCLIKVPNSNTGAPLDAGKLRLWFTNKLNSLFKKLSVPGFKHYTEFEKWQRKYFQEAIESILFDPRTLERGLYRKEGLEEVFRDHISGKKNYSRLLGTIVGLELWFREFVD